MGKTVFNIKLIYYCQLSQTQPVPLRHTVLSTPPTKTATKTILTSTATSLSYVYLFPENPLMLQNCKLEMNDSTMRISQHLRF